MTRWWRESSEFDQEYLFCDTIDEQYALMSEQVGPTYEMWRQATLEQAEWLAQYEQRAAMREAKASDSQFSGCTLNMLRIVRFVFRSKRSSSWQRRSTMRVNPRCSEQKIRWFA